jgi:hypothetical protein
MPRKSAGPNGKSVYMFFNNPSGRDYLDASGAGLSSGYDVYTATGSRLRRYSVSWHYDAISPGDLAVVYRLSPRDDLAGVAAVARIRSGGLTDRTGFKHVKWQLLRLPPELIITKSTFLADARWRRRTPFVAGQRARGPVELTADDWMWIESRLPVGARSWLRK